MKDAELLLMQARYVLRDLAQKHPKCGYDKLAAACEEAALEAAEPVQQEGE